MNFNRVSFLPAFYRSRCRNEQYYGMAPMEKNVKRNYMILQELGDDIRTGRIQLSLPFRQYLADQGFVFAKHLCTKQERIQMLRRFHAKHGQFNITPGDTMESKLLYKYYREFHKGKSQAEVDDDLLFLGANGFISPKTNPKSK
jgi:hypothetical protein